MTPLLFLLLVPQAVAPDQGIYSGFTLHWMRGSGGANSGLGQVALSGGSAVIDGSQVESGAANGPDYVLPVPVAPWVPLFNVGDSYVVYCYVVDLGPVAVVNPWFAPLGVGNNDTYDFDCAASQGAGANYSPTGDGHPTNPLPYPGVAGGVTKALFVGSAVGTFLVGNVLYGGNPQGFGIIPFFRNGSQTVYTSTNHPCAGCLSGTNWDLGLRSVQNTGTFGPVCPVVESIDLTADGLKNLIPLSASQVLLETEGFAHVGENTSLCFMDPNHNGFNPITYARSCQTEILIEGSAGTDNWRPFTPGQAQLNPGLSTTRGTYGEFWIGAFNNAAGGILPMNAKMYFDLRYRGYLEPERQLKPQVHQ